MYCYNVLLAIATNIPLLLMTGFVVQVPLGETMNLTASPELL